MRFLTSVKCLAAAGALLFLACAASQSAENEFALYGRDGRAAAYIAIGEEMTIYLWGGEPVAYLHEGESVYSFAGKHLGWFEGGIVRDHNGLVVGGLRGVFSSPLQPDPFKGFKQFKPFKAFRELAPLHPLKRTEWSNIPLAVFLKTGAAGTLPVATAPAPAPTRSMPTDGFRIDLKVLMASQQFAECGLNRLTTDELSKLEEWIGALCVVFAARSRASSVLGSGGQGSLGEHWIQGKSTDGSVLTLEDGSIWEVGPVDRIYTMLWLPTETVILLSETEMLNKDNGEKVGVRRLK